MSPTTNESVRIRPVSVDDLPWMFDMQLDSEANQMAVARPRKEADFYSHWTSALQAPNVYAHVITFDANPVGTISCFPFDGQPHVGYWLYREHWGKKIASRAVRLLLEKVPIRPLHAFVASSNLASLRVLQKNGFMVQSIRMAPETERFPACEETVLILPA